MAWVQKIKSLLGSKPAQALVDVSDTTSHMVGTPVVPLTELTCTYCGGHEFYAGPSAGMMTNVICANSECRHWFNTCPGLGIFHDLNKQDTEGE